MKNLQTATELTKQTKVFTILDEQKMEIVKWENSSTAMMFATESEANKWASSNLEMWDVVKSQFNHKWIQHQQNTKPEITKVVGMGMNDTDNLSLNVWMRFADLIVVFNWTKNIKSGLVHSDETPLTFNGDEMGDEDWAHESDSNMSLWKRWMKASDKLNFDEVVFDMVEAIEGGLHHIE